MGPMHPPGPMRMMGPPPGGILGVAPPGFNPMMGPGGQRFPGVYNYPLHSSILETLCLKKSHL